MNDGNGKPRWLWWVVGVVVSAAAIAAAIVAAPEPRSRSAPVASSTIRSQRPESAGVTGAALATKRARALLAGDEKAWLEDLDPANPRLIASERMRFINIRLLRPSQFLLTGNELTNGGYNGSLHVQQIMQMSSEVRPTKAACLWRLKVGGGRTVITGVEPFRATMPLGDAYAAKPPNVNLPWDLVPLRAATGDGVTVISAVSSRWDPQAYLPGARRAADLMRSLWRNRPGAGTFTVFLADERQFATWFGATDAERSAIGHAVFAEMVEPDGRRRLARPNTPLPKGGEPMWKERTAGARIVLRMEKISSLDHARYVMAHEMAHAVGPHLMNLYRTDSGRIDQPLWVVEGFARYVENLAEPNGAATGRAFVRANKRRYAPGGGAVMPRNAGFYSKDNRRTTFNYEIGAALFAAADKVGGRQKAVDLYITLTNQMEITADVRFMLDESLIAVGLDPDTVWRQFA